MTRHGAKGIASGDAIGIVLASVVGLLVLAGAARASLVITTDTGLRVTIHSADDIQARWLVNRDGRTWLEHPLAGAVELETEQPSWSQLVPVASDVVAAAVMAMHGFQTALDVEIFLLPGYPAAVRSSFARRDAIFLAPGLAPQAAETVAYVTTHELGHVLCWAAVDGRPARWEAYRELRGLPAEQLAPSQVAHAERHREIIAEDIRFLFGGPLAVASGTIENARLPLPTAIAGLQELLAAFLADPLAGGLLAAPSSVYPNPCRAAATIELKTGDTFAKQGASAPGPVLEIFDARGRLIRRLPNGRTANGRVTVVWDGNLADGKRAPAGQYLYRITGHGRTGSGKLLLLAR
jgi:hypothetical protein